MTALIKAFSQSVLGSLVGNDPDPKDAPTATEQTSAKRPASPSDPAEQPTTKRPRARPSSDERRLFAHYTPTRDSVAIPLPANQWTTMSSRKKPMPGGFQPRNTLTATPGGRYAPLSTTKSIGSNVRDRSPKRQKTSHTSSPPRSENTEDGGWFDRDTLLTRQPSVVSLRSQSQDNSSQKQRFDHSEFKSVNSTLNPPKKSRRKPKPSASQEKNMPGTNNDPVSVDDEDVIPLADKPSSFGSARKPAIQRLPRVAEIVSSPSQSSYQELEPGAEVEGNFSRKLKASQNKSQQPRQVVRVEIPVSSGEKPIERSIKASTTPRLNDTFVRDDATSQSRLRDRMRTSSVAANTVIRESTELSEDELAGESNVLQSPQKLVHSRTQRGRSPNDIVSTHFQKGRKKDKHMENLIVPLTLLCMKAGVWQEDYVFLIYSYEHRGIQFHDSKTQTPLTSGNSVIQLEAKHAHKVMFSKENLNGLLLFGARDALSKGRILFDFKTQEDREKVRTAISHLTDDKVIWQTISDLQFERACESSRTMLEPDASITNPELQAMERRQVENTTMNARQRAMAAQRGIDLPEPAFPENQAPPTRKVRMKAEFTSQPAAPAEQDFSLPPPARTQSTTTTRSSRRIQDQDVGRATQPAEPAPKRWTRIHGVPEWDAPLTYPATGPKRTTVDAKDIERLDDGEFLNDNLISFYLRYLEVHNPELADKVHIFNTFFYTALSTTKSGKRGLNYEAVKRWTRNIDLFKHPFVAVPINANFHWFLVIICNLDKLERKLNNVDDLEEEPQEVEHIQSQSTIAPNDLEIPESPQEIKDEQLSQGVNKISLDASQESDLPSPGKLKPAPRKGGKKGQQAQQKIEPNTPALILLDSLGSSHTTEIRNLKEYVALEGFDKKSLDFEYNVLRGVTARGIPQQTNFCDCGVYLIGYMEAFLRDPREFVRKVFSKELDRDNDFADFDPAKKRAQLRELLLKLAEEQKQEKKAKKKEAHLAKKLGVQGSGYRVATPTGGSSPLKGPTARETNRMVQSSPIKRPLPAMREPDHAVFYQRSSPPGPDIQDEMLFDGNHGPVVPVSNEDFEAQLQQAANQANQARYED